MIFSVYSNLLFLRDGIFFNQSVGLSWIKTKLMRSTILLFFTLLYSTITAQWNNSTSINNAICNFAGNQTLAQVISDGAGGAIITWVDTRNGAQDIYAQRIDATGTLLWNVDGIAICNAASD